VRQFKKLSTEYIIMKFKFLVHITYGVISKESGTVSQNPTGDASVQALKNPLDRANSHPHSIKAYNTHLES